MPKLTCKNCNGTGDANYDLPADEYVKYPCEKCNATGIENYCHSCNGTGETVDASEYNTVLLTCWSCSGTGYELDSIEVDRDCEHRVPYDLFGTPEKDVNGEIKCIYCLGTGKYKEILVEGTSEYAKYKSQ